MFAVRRFRYIEVLISTSTLLLLRLGISFVIPRTSLGSSSSTVTIYCDNIYTLIKLSAVLENNDKKKKTLLI